MPTIDPLRIKIHTQTESKKWKKIFYGNANEKK